MGLRINTNVLSLNAQNNLKGTNAKLATSLERLGTGLRINSGKDDVVGLLKSESLRSQIRGIAVSKINLSNAQSILGVAEGTLSQLTSIGQQIRDNVVQAADQTISTSDRSNLSDAISQLKEEFDRLVNASEFDGTKLLDGNFSNKTFQVGPNAGDTIAFSLSNTKATNIGKVAVLTASVVSAAQRTSFTTATFTAADGFTINGTTISAANLTSNADTVSSVENDQSAIAYVAAINDVSGVTGVTAKVLSNIITITYLGAVSSTTEILSTDQLSINGVNIAKDNYETNDGDMSSLVDAINDLTSSTGVTASIDTTNNTIVLTASDGRNINMGIDQDTAGTAHVARTLFNSSESFSITSNTVSNAGGSFTFSAGFTLTSDSVFTLNNANTGEGIGTSNTITVTVSNDTALNDLDVSTAANAELGLEIMDNVIRQLQNKRAEVGSKSIRLAAAESELDSRSQNFTAAESVIRDTDIAQETAKLTSYQILQQAGVSVLQRASALPQIALTLLQG